TSSVTICERPAGGVYQRRIDLPANEYSRLFWQAGDPENCIAQDGRSHRGGRIVQPRDLDMEEQCRIRVAGERPGCTGRIWNYFRVPRLWKDPRLAFQQRPRFFKRSTNGFFRAYTDQDEAWSPAESITQ